MIDFTRLVTMQEIPEGYTSLQTSVLTDNALGLVAVGQFSNKVHLSYIHHHT